MDAVSAYHSSTNEEVYICFPDGMQLPGKCLKLNKALYGLKRSPLLWYQDFSETLISLGLQRVLEAECLFVY